MQYVLVVIVAVELLARGIPVMWEGWAAVGQLRAMAANSTASSASAKAPRCEDVVADVLLVLTGEMK